MKKLITVKFVILVTCLPVIALPLRVIPWDEEIAKRKIAIAQGNEVKSTGFLHPSARSNPIRVTIGELPVRLVALDRTDDNGQNMEIKVKFPAAGIKRPLLIVLPDKKSAIGMRTLVIEDDLAQFGWGSIRLLNASSKSLVFRWDKKAEEIRAGGKPVDIKPGGANRNMAVYLYQKGDYKKPLYTGVWEHRNDMRKLVFITTSNDPTLGPYRFKIIPQKRLAGNR